MIRKHIHHTAKTLVIGTAIVLFWRGAWGLMDMFLFPQDQLTSYSVSILLGVSILIITDKLTDGLL